MLIVHRAGYEVWPCESAARAWDQLHAYVLEWWPEELGKVATPSDPAEAIAAYFNAQKKKTLPAVGELFHIFPRDMVTKASLRASKVKKPKRAKKAPAKPAKKAWKRKELPDDD